MRVNPCALRLSKQGQLGAHQRPQVCCICQMKRFLPNYFKTLGNLSLSLSLSLSRVLHRSYMQCSVWQRTQLVPWPQDLMTSTPCTRGRRWRSTILMLRVVWCWVMEWHMPGRFSRQSGSSTWQLSLELRFRVQLVAAVAVLPLQLWHVVVEWVFMQVYTAPSTGMFFGKSY